MKTYHTFYDLRVDDWHYSYRRYNTNIVVVEDSSVEQILRYMGSNRKTYEESYQNTLLVRLHLNEEAYIHQDAAMSLIVDSRDIQQIDFKDAIPVQEIWNDE